MKTDKSIVKGASLLRPIPMFALSFGSGNFGAKPASALPADKDPRLRSLRGLVTTAANS